MKTLQSTDFSRDVVAGLRSSPKTLPPKYLYDELGSTIFESICHLPWYAVTRAEVQLLTQCAKTIARAAPAKTIIELGPGSGHKLSLLAKSLAHTLEIIHLVDLSSTALVAATAAVARVSRVPVMRHVTSFEKGLRASLRSTAGETPRLVLFLGSTLGNYEPPEAQALLSTMGRLIRREDRVLIGVDLVKPAGDLRLAYDDPLGITAAFNKNLLVRINREMDGNFVLERFTHRAIWNSRASRVEMHLVSRVDHWVRLRSAGVRIRFGRGESICTEHSYKYEPSTLRNLGTSVGLDAVEQWIQGRDEFALTLYASRRPHVSTHAGSTSSDDNLSGDSGGLELNVPSRGLAVGGGEGRADRHAQPARDTGSATGRPPSSGGRSSRRRVPPKRAASRH